MLRHCLAACFSLLVVTSCGTDRSVETGTPSAPLARAAQCRVRSPGIVFSGAGRADSASFDGQVRMTMIGDGGWCWAMSSTYIGPTKSASWLDVTEQPRNGEVQLSRMQEATRVAYRANPGFIGDDAFTVHDETLNVDRRYAVTVVPRRR